jgi:YgiT-type zinc finger domain-containing protein
MKCAICKTGQTAPGKTTVTLQRAAATIVIIRDVPAEICDNCGEYYLDAAVTNQIYTVAELSLTRHVEVEILRYAA